MLLSFSVEMVSGASYMACHQATTVSWIHFRFQSCNSLTRQRQDNQEVLACILQCMKADVTYWLVKQEKDKFKKILCNPASLTFFGQNAGPETYREPRFLSPKEILEISRLVVVPEFFFRRKRSADFRRTSQTDERCLGPLRLLKQSSRCAVAQLVERPSKGPSLVPLYWHGFTG